MVKNLPAMQETQVQSLDWENPPEKGMATHFSILAWRIPWTEEPGGFQSIGLQRVRHESVTKHTFVSATVVIPSSLQILATNSNTGCLVIQVNRSA